MTVTVSSMFYWTLLRCCWWTDFISKFIALTESITLLLVNSVKLKGSDYSPNSTPSPKIYKKFLFKLSICWLLNRCIDLFLWFSAILVFLHIILNLHRQQKLELNHKELLLPPLNFSWERTETRNISWKLFINI